MDFTYQKNDNATLFKTLEDADLLNVSKIQNYIPIYERFFSLNETNFNNINLNQELKVTKIMKRHSENKYVGLVENKKGQVSEKHIFFKMIPLIDPIKYITGKYDISDTNLLNLPTLTDQTRGMTKVRDSNNAAYVDSFFSYLTSVTYHHYGFIHGLDFYGSYLGMKNDYMFNIADDLDYLHECKPFHENRGVLYTYDTTFQSDFMNFGTRNFKEPLKMTDETLNDKDILELSDISDLSDLNKIFKEFKTKNGSESTGLYDISATLLYDSPVVLRNMDEENSDACSDTSETSNCSSRSSNTVGSSNDIDSLTIEGKKREKGNDSQRGDRDTDTDTDTDEDEDGDEYSFTTASEDEAFVKIPCFPVQLVALEKCEKTLDSLISTEEPSYEEYGSIVTQILMILIVYQKVFGLTHNDLHTNNIMYVRTDKQYLYYKYNGNHYKVPTFGKIYKIIDFGRAIYKFRGNVLCSDSYHPKGDAATQYNFEPYLNENKPRIEPNFSFDLCRLGCALYDMLEESKDKDKPIIKIMMNWCNDDKGRNILYKTNGEERYPEFKLYKMIARSVHNHIPSDVIKDEYFTKYQVSKKKIQKIQKHKIFNVDKLESLQ